PGCWTSTTTASARPSPSTSPVARFSLRDVTTFDAEPGAASRSFRPSLSVTVLFSIVKVAFAGSGAGTVDAHAGKTTMATAMASRHAMFMRLADLQLFGGDADVNLDL